MAGVGAAATVADPSLNTLYHLRFASIYRAERGRHGEGSNRTGRSGDDLEIRLPLGTLVSDVESGSPLGEILQEDDRVLLAEGGRGGRGNARFATATRQAPRFAQPGEEGGERRVKCELRLIADVGLVGLPNAGKSTLISRVSAARPKVADYPFTTLEPKLGVVGGGRVERPFVIADLPGLIAGAAQGAGLGHRFLRHIERCRQLLHLVDVATGEAPADEELAVIEGELRDFDPALLDKPRMIIASKIDAADPDRLAALRAAAAERELHFHAISSVSGTGIDELVALLTERLANAPSEAVAERADEDADSG